MAGLTQTANEFLTEFATSDTFQTKLFEAITEIGEPHTYRAEIDRGVERM